MKVLTAKTYKFVDDIWKAHLNYIMQDHMYDHIRLVAKNLDIRPHLDVINENDEDDNLSDDGFEVEIDEYDHEEV